MNKKNVLSFVIGAVLTTSSMMATALEFNVPNHRNTIIDPSRVVAKPVNIAPLLIGNIKVRNLTVSPRTINLELADGERATENQEISVSATYINTNHTRPVRDADIFWKVSEIDLTGKGYIPSRHAYVFDKQGDISLNPGGLRRFSGSVELFGERTRVKFLTDPARKTRNYGRTYICAMATQQNPDIEYRNKNPLAEDDVKCLPITVNVNYVH